MHEKSRGFRRNRGLLLSLSVLFHRQGYNIGANRVAVRIGDFAVQHAAVAGSSCLERVGGCGAGALLPLGAGGVLVVPLVGQAVGIGYSVRLFLAVSALYSFIFFKRAKPIKEKTISRITNAAYIKNTTAAAL